MKKPGTSGLVLENPCLSPGSWLKSLICFIKIWKYTGRCKVLLHFVLSHVVGDFDDPSLSPLPHSSRYHLKNVLCQQGDQGLFPKVPVSREANFPSRRRCFGSPDHLLILLREMEKNHPANLLKDEGGSTLGGTQRNAAVVMTESDKHGDASGLILDERSSIRSLSYDIST